MSGSVDPDHRSLWIKHNPKMAKAVNLTANVAIYVNSGKKICLLVNVSLEQCGFTADNNCITAKPLSFDLPDYLPDRMLSSRVCN
jgi:hypothetical protein